MFNTIIPYKSASLIYPGFQIFTNPTFSALSNVSIFSAMTSPMSATCSNIYSYTPLFSSIGNYFSYIFSNFSFSSFLPKFTLLGSSSVRTSVTAGGQKVVVSGEVQNISFWEKFGYNAKNGLKLAKDAASHVADFTKQCATYVKNAIVRCGLGTYKKGNGCDMVRILSGNKNFKQISPDGVDVKKLPAGCILVFDKGVSRYNTKYGHTEITTGTGKAVSDGVTNNIRKPSAIFIPV